MWLTPATYSILRDMKAAEDRDDLEGAEIACDGGLCYVGNRRIAKASVNRLLGMLAISPNNFGGGGEYYRLNDTGRAFVRRPSLVQDIVRATIVKRPFTIQNDRLVFLDEQEPT